jgi:uncharacterized protein YbjT (DUF2867 family)
MFVIAGVSGRTGSVVASTLLERGKKVRVIVRDAAKGASWQARGAEVAVASLDDAEALGRALEGAEGVYALIPPDFAADDPLAAQARVVDAWARAIETARPKHVVLLSSVGAELPEGTGPIVTVHRAEQKLGRSAAALTALRASYFQENWGSVVAPMKANGIVPSMITPGHALPMVATADIGRVAAEALLEGTRAAKVIELAGPRDYSPEDVAEIFGGALGKALNLVAVPAEGIEPALTAAGLKPKLAALFREMNVAFNAGKLAFKGTPQRGRVELAETARKLVA